ncbi:hypothetical protein Taro_024334, partial [Colocasia esculenta]|nr:hypothetical protein [Colocasia esculenta]
YRKKGAALKGHTSRTCKKATLNSHYKRSCSQLTLLTTHGATTATTTVRQRTPATASPYLKRVGGEPREQGSVGITSPLPARAAGTPTSGSKTTLQNSKARKTYCRVLQSSGNRVNALTTTRVKPKTTMKHNAEANPRHTPAEINKLTEPRSDHVRLESHDTSTNISDFHEVGKEQPGVTTRDTKQPGEKSISPPPWPPQTSTRLRAHKQNHPGPWTRHKV